MAEIIIDRWYKKENTDLINKNTIDKVEFLENSTDIVGGDVFHINAYMFGDSSEQKFLDNGFASLSFKANSGSNEHSAWSDRISTSNEKLVDLTLTFENKFGDTSPGAYSIKSKSMFQYSDTQIGDGFQTWEFLHGSLVTPSDASSGSITAKTTLGFSEDNIILTIEDLLVSGSYSVTFEGENSQYNSTRVFKPYTYNIMVVYGGLKTTKEKIAYGDGEKSLSFEENSLIEAHAKIGDKTLSQDIAEKILTEYKYGKQTISLRVLADKFYDKNNNLVIDINSDDDNIKHLIEIGDVFTLRKMGKYLCEKPNGEPKRFMVTKADLYFSGKPTMQIEGVEMV